VAVLPNFLASAILASYEAADAQATYPKIDVRRVTGDWRGSSVTYKIKVVLQDPDSMSVAIQRRS